MAKCDGTHRQTAGLDFFRPLWEAPWRREDQEGTMSSTAKTSAMLEPLWPCVIKNHQSMLATIMMMAA